MAVVIVSWNTRDLLRACLASVFADVPAGTRVVVVDSASADGTAGMVGTEFPQVALHALDENIGYVRGNNLALRALLSAGGDRPEFLWLLNPDTRVVPGCAARLLAFMEQHPRCGLCGPGLLNPDGSLQHGSFAFPGLLQLTLELVPRLARFRNSRLDGRYPARWYAAGRPFRVGHPLGAAMLARTEAVVQIGALDEGFEMYCEEVDWAARMAEAGWERWCVPAAQVVHHGGASSSQTSARAQQLLWRSRRRYYRKHYGSLRRWLALRLATGQPG